VQRALGIAATWGIGVFYVLVAVDWLNVEPAPQLAAGIALGAASGLCLWWRRVWPEAVTAATVVFGVPFHLLVPEFVIPFAALVALWSLAMTRPPRVSLIGLAGVLGLAAVNFVAAPVDDTLFAIVVAVSVWALAEAARSRRAAIREAARRAVGDEQARIARELHDVIAHSVSVIVVQAAAADDVFDAHPEQARTALRSIEGAGRDALRELRRLLGAVRDGGPADAGTSVPPDAADTPVPPQPSMDRVDELAQPLRAAGLRVMVTQQGEPTRLPAGVDLSAYRIVQEALTNTLRHARATRTEVTLRYGPDELEIDVVDDGVGTPGLGGDGPGYGVMGMRERASLVGGTLEAGPTPHGGYRVHAVLPLEGVL
jgi:signal transduction histidine kinase